MHFCFGVLFWVCRGCPSLAKSREAIAPFRSGPSLLRYVWTDVYNCLAGQSLRHYRKGACCSHTRGAFVIAWHFTVMIMIMPTVKYWMNANFWVYQLGLRYVQQISTSMADLGVPRCVKTAQKIISQSVQELDMQSTIETWDFVPHYPYPRLDSSRRFAIGMQQGGRIFTLLVHTTHARMEVDGCTEQLVISNSAQVPVYRVMLWYNNPYHFFTGFVEASISTGGSQTDKPDSGEHPMWLVSAHSPMTAGRLSQVTGTGFIDRFFDNWLPKFVEMMRSVATGNEAYAKARHQEVLSKDGVSVPLSPGKPAQDDPDIDLVAAGTQVIPDAEQVKQEWHEAQEELKRKQEDLVANLKINTAKLTEQVATNTAKFTDQAAHLLQFKPDECARGSAEHEVTTPAAAPTAAPEAAPAAASAETAAERPGLLGSLGRSLSSLLTPRSQDETEARPVAVTPAEVAIEVADEAASPAAH